MALFVQCAPLQLQELRAGLRQRGKLLFWIFRHGLKPCPFKALFHSQSALPLGPNTHVHRSNPKPGFAGYPTDAAKAAQFVRRVREMKNPTQRTITPTTAKRALVGDPDKNS